MSASNWVVRAKFLVSDIPRWRMKSSGLTCTHLVSNHVMINSRLLMNIIEALFEDFSQLFSLIYYIFIKNGDTYLQIHWKCIR